MAVNGREKPGEKVIEFFTQSPEDRAYEKAGGDARVPQEKRAGDPHGEARRFALVNGEEDPYPDEAPLAPVEDDDAEVVVEESQEDSPKL